MKYYSLNRIEKENADYNIIYGERSNGKTFACLERVIKRYFEKGEQGAYIRRYDADFKGKRGAVLFDGVVEAGIIKKYSEEWTGVYYYAGRWFLSKKDGEKVIKSDVPLMYAFSLSSMEHDKSTSFPKITTVIFDEFLTRNGELSDEFNIFLNVLSTIIRQRNDVKIFLLGNTVNKESSYFHQMNIYNIIKKMKKGEIQVVTTEKGLKIAVEYAETPEKKKPSDKYYDFKASTSRMIIGGEWEIKSYPRSPGKHTEKDVYFRYFIIYRDYIIQCDMVKKDEMLYTLCYRKKGNIKNPDKDYIFSDRYDGRRNWHRYIDQNVDRMSAIIYRDIKTGNIFFTDDETGEILRNFILTARNEKSLI